MAGIDYNCNRSNSAKIWLLIFSGKNMRRTSQIKPKSPIKSSPSKSGIREKISTEDQADTLIVLDFETTGLSPEYGDRAIEIGAVRIERGKITDRFQQLMNPGFRISGFIESYTGITNKMLKKAPPCDEVMAQFYLFMGTHNLVAHNASFDKSFLDAEFSLIGKSAYQGNFACSMLIARRIYQDAPNHKLGSLVKFKKIPTNGVFHRALADSEMTAMLWLKMLGDIRDQYRIPSITFQLMQQLSRKPKNAVERFLSKSGKGQERKK